MLTCVECGWEVPAQLASSVFPGRGGHRLWLKKEKAPLTPWESAFRLTLEGKGGGSPGRSPTVQGLSSFPRVCSGCFHVPICAPGVGVLRRDGESPFPKGRE